MNTHTHICVHMYVCIYGIEEALRCESKQTRERSLEKIPSMQRRGKDHVTTINFLKYSSYKGCQVQEEGVWGRGCWRKGVTRESKKGCLEINSMMTTKHLLGNSTGDVKETFQKEEPIRMPGWGSVS